MREPLDDFGPSTGSQSLWQRNHGTFLLGVTALVFTVGAGILLFQQLRFRDVRFPDGDSITSPDDRAPETAAADGPHITIIATGAKNDDGKMRLAIYDTANEFNEPTKAILKSPQPIVDGSAKWLVAISQLPQSFAIAAFHDRNSDGLLNRDGLGIPVESYGFSNKARAMFGPPSFEQAVISRPSEERTIEIPIQ